MVWCRKSRDLASISFLRHSLYVPHPGMSSFSLDCLFQSTYSSSQPHRHSRPSRKDSFSSTTNKHHFPIRTTLWHPWSNDYNHGDRMNNQKWEDRSLIQSGGTLLGQSNGITARKATLVSNAKQFTFREQKCAWLIGIWIDWWKMLVNSNKSSISLSMWHER